MSRFFLLLLITVHCVLVTVKADTVGPLRSFPPEERLVGHSDSINAVAFSPDGRFIVSGSDDNLLKIWDIVSGTEIRTLLGHSQGVSTTAFSPDGRFIVSGSRDTTLKLWDTATGAEIRTLSGHSYNVNAVSFSPDGLFIVSGENQYNCSDCTLIVWNVSTGTEVHILSGHSGGIYATAFSPDGRFIVSGSEDKTLKMWDTTTGEELRAFVGHTWGINAVAWSPDGRFVVSGSGNTLKLWDAATGTEIRTHTGHSDNITAVAFSPDVRLIVSWSRDNTIKLWDVASGTEIHTLSGHTSWVLSAAFSPAGHTIVSAGTTLKLWDTVTGVEIRTMGYNHRIAAFTIAPDGRTLVSGSSDHTLKLWNAATGAEIHTLIGHTDDLTAVAWSLDGRHIVSGSWDDTLKLWDAATGSEIRTFSGHTSDISAVAFSPDGRLIVSSADDLRSDFSLKLWDTVMGTEIRTLAYIISHAVAFSPDGRFVVSGVLEGSLGKLKLWDVATGSEIRTFSGYHADGNIITVAFSPDGRSIVSGGYDNTLKLWERATGMELRTFFGHTELIYTLAFSPDGRFIVSGSWDDTLKVWDVTSGAELRTLTGHSSIVTGAEWSPSGRYIYSASTDRTIKLWRSGIDVGPELTLPEELTLVVGQTQPITPITGGPAQSWQSADETIATVDPTGTVTGLQPGNTKITAYDADGLPHSVLVRVTAGDTESFGRAIVIAGGGAHRQNTLFEYSNDLARRMYGLLKSRGFNDDEIYYFNPDTFQDIDGDGRDDGVTDYQLFAPWTELNAAVDEIAPVLLPGQQLVFYLHGHGDNRGSAPMLRMNQSDELSAAQLQQLLAKLPPHAQQVVILDTCFSGAFLAALAGHPNRIVLTSADAESPAWNIRQENFSNVFINGARRGMNLNDAFLETERMIQRNPKQFAGQKPYLDDDSDGIYSPTREGRIAARTWLGRPGVAASGPPEITATAGGGDGLWARSFPAGPDRIRKVRAVLSRAIESQYDRVLYQGEATDFERITLDLAHNDEENRWQAQFNAFPSAGTWRVARRLRCNKRSPTILCKTSKKPSTQRARRHREHRVLKPFSVCSVSL